MRKVGTTVEQLYQNLPSVAAEERITQQQCDYDGRAKSTTQHDFGYLIIVNHGKLVETLEEFRTDSKMTPVDSTGVGEDFNFTKDFASLWLLFYPDNQSLINFRYLGWRPAATGTPAPLPSGPTRRWLRAKQKRKGGQLCCCIKGWRGSTWQPIESRECASIFWNRDSTSGWKG